MVYYSRVKRTEEVARSIAQDFRSFGVEVDLLKIEPKGKKTIFGLGYSAFFKKRCLLKDVNKELKAYDLVLFGTPIHVWSPSSPIISFIYECSGLEDKRVAVFVTGRGFFKSRAISILEHMIKNKHAEFIGYFALTKIGPLLPHDLKKTVKFSQKLITGCMG